MPGLKTMMRGRRGVRCIYDAGDVNRLDCSHVRQLQIQIGRWVDLINSTITIVKALDHLRVIRIAVCAIDDEAIARWIPSRLPLWRDTDSKRVVLARVRELPRCVVDRTAGQSKTDKSSQCEKRSI
jgi:hypothetical protein